MSEPMVNQTATGAMLNGQEVQSSDLANLGAVAGLADDRVLAELLRMAPYAGGGIYKAIVPTSGQSASSPGTLPQTQPTVRQTFTNNGSVAIYPFRAVIGTRNLLATPPPTNPAVNYQSTFLANWRDIRSAVFAPNGFQLQAFAANSSGNPRWDLVYATVAVDVNGPSVTRRVKNPSSGGIAPVPVPQFLTSLVTVNVAQGTPGATPTPPPPPADAAGNYTIPLAWVRIPNGFSGTSTIVGSDIRATLNGVPGGGTPPLSQFQALSAAMRMRPASGNHDGSGSLYTNFAWNASAGGRPGPFMAPDWVGGDMVMCELDFQTGGSYSHPSGAIVDNSIDWRNRIVRVDACAMAGNKFAQDSTGTTSRVPLATQAIYSSLGNSFTADAQLVAGASTLAYWSPTQLPAMAASSLCGVYVDPATGNLLAYVSGAATPTVRIFAWIMASAPCPNY
jgi:hypothetical protein